MISYTGHLTGGLESTLDPLWTRYGLRQVQLGQSEPKTDPPGEIFHRSQLDLLRTPTKFTTDFEVYSNLLQVRSKVLNKSVKN